MKKKFLTLAISLMLVISIICIACTPSVRTSEDVVAIYINKAQENETLLMRMENLQNKGDLAFTMQGSMVSSINNKENASDYSFCWMLYTDDLEMANEAWGVFEYEGKTYYSAILGAQDLVIKSNCTYIWAYITF